MYVKKIWPMKTDSDTEKRIALNNGVGDSSNFFWSYFFDNSWVRNHETTRYTTKLSPKAKHGTLAATIHQDMPCGNEKKSCVWGAGIAQRYRVQDSWSKGHRIEFRQKWQENFLFQGQLSVLINDSYFGSLFYPPVLMQ